MRTLLKKLYKIFPFSLQRWVLRGYEKLYRKKTINRLKHEGVSIEISKKRLGEKPRVLFYHISGLSFAGTEKFLQILAKHLGNNFEIFYLYSPKPRQSSGGMRLDGRADYFNDTEVKLVEFDYDELEQVYPYYIRGAKPDIFEVIRKNNIDIMITAGSGCAEYPMNVINGIPIITLNIFGSPNVQPNIVKNICISHEVAQKVQGVVPQEKIEVMYILSEGPQENSIEKGKEIRESFGIKENDMVFGRIGRPDDDIFDPIGIEAFKKVVTIYPNTHYIIMAPPPKLVQIVSDQKIKNVHFLKPSGKEEDVWAFHNAIDALAHFRYDGESCGLNIIESMLCSKPVITHRSPIWNAHLEYLDTSYARIAGIGDINTYAGHMAEFVKLKKRGALENMGKEARAKALEIASVEHNIPRLKSWIVNALSR